MEGKCGAMAKKWVVSSQTVVGMLVVQLIATGMQLLSKIILNNGTFVFALMTYRHVVAALCVAPMAFFLERGIKKRMSWSVLGWLFVNALIGITLAMGLYYYGLKDTTAAYAVNFLNLIPIVTFILSIIVRIENLGLGTKAGKIKTLGVILCLAGALTSGLYKGKSFFIFHHIVHENAHVEVSKAHWARGSVMLVGSCVCYAAWYILQVKVLKILPLKYWATMLTCIMASIQSAIVGLCIDRNKASWKLGWNLQLVTILYSGALATAATFCLLSWAVSKRGPSYPAMFNPLTLIFVVILQALILGSEISVGMLVGMALIIVGLYAFFTGKNKESNRLPVPNVEAVEAVTIVVDPEQVQATSAAVHPQSPSSTTNLK